MDGVVKSISNQLKTCCDAMSEDAKDDFSVIIGYEWPQDSIQFYGVNTIFMDCTINQCRNSVDDLIESLPVDKKLKYVEVKRVSDMKVVYYEEHPRY